LTYRQLRKDLLAQLGVTPQRLSQLTKQLKQTYGPMSTQEAVCLLAHQRGLDLDRYLDEGKLASIRQLATVAPSPGPAPPRKRPRERAAKPVHVTIAREIKLSDPVLPQRIIKEAKLMAEAVYPIMYIFENSVREVIQRVMTKAYGGDWWTTNAPKDVRSKVQSRIQKEEKTPWHGRRGAHPIYYTDIDDLTHIVRARQNWPHFAPVFPTQTWFTQRVEELAPSRNVVAHNNPLGQDDIKRLEVYLNDWQKQIKAVRDVII
jgi:hypothetical protein